MSPSPSVTAPSARSSLVNGFNHVAVVARDLDRLVGFYADVFDVPFVEVPDERGRHGFLSLGPGRRDVDPGPVLHAFEVPEDMTGPFPSAGDMFRRGRLDHIAIEAAGETELQVLRERLVACGASDGVVRIFGGWLLSMHAVHPAGTHTEVGCR